MTLSALAPEADIRHRIEHVCFVPIADINHHLFSAVVIALIRLFHLRDEIPFPCDLSLVLVAVRPQHEEIHRSPLHSAPCSDQAEVGDFFSCSLNQSDLADTASWVLFERFGPEYQSSVLNHLLRPRLDIGTSISTKGGTNEVYAGLTWDVFLTRRLFLEGSAGGALHTEDDRDFGCTANFRESGSVGVMLSERWDMLATMAHMSNANLCDENRGLTDVGIRFGRKW